MSRFDQWLETVFPDHQQKVVAWIATLTPEMRALVKEWPPRSVIKVDGSEYYLLNVAMNETPGFIFSRIDPAKDLRRAMNETVFMCFNRALDVPSEKMLEALTIASVMQDAISPDGE